MLSPGNETVCLWGPGVYKRLGAAVLVGVARLPQVVCRSLHHLRERRVYVKRVCYGVDRAFARVHGVYDLLDERRGLRPQYVGAQYLVRVLLDHHLDEAVLLVPGGAPRRGHGV